MLFAVSSFLGSRKGTEDKKGLFERQDLVRHFVGAYRSLPIHFADSADSDSLKFEVLPLEEE